MSGLTGHRTFVPTINADNHGAKVVVCGALMLPPVAMMVSLSVYNRIRAKTLLYADGMIMLLGTVCHRISQESHRHTKLTPLALGSSRGNICDVCPCKEPRFWKAHGGLDRRTAAFDQEC